jgi:hypothetical protein
MRIHPPNRTILPSTSGALVEFYVRWYIAIRRREIMFDTWPKNHYAAPFLLLLLAAWICTTRTAHAQSVETPKKEKDKAAELKTLLKERRDTLQKVLDSSIDLARRGRGGLQAVVEAEREALRATLEVDEEPEVRLAMLKKCNEHAKEFFKIAEMGFENGRVSQVDLLKMKALALEAQIELLREELRAKKSK